MKVVVDTMFWVSYCTFEKGYRHRLINRAVRQRARFFVSAYILDEVNATLIEDLGRTRRFAYLARKQVLRIARLIVVRVNGRKYVSGDPDDDPIVRTALSAKADYLVTADREILKLGKVQDLEILNAAQFEQELGEEAMRHE